MFAYPVLPAACNTPLKERRNQIGITASAETTAFLSNSRFPVVFDSVVYGQALSGVDPRNTQGFKMVGYINETALFTIIETDFQWTRREGRWIPTLNRIPLVNLHIHSKALSCFLSDSVETPNANYNALELQANLEAAYK
jgi:hypothetical protein